MYCRTKECQETPFRLVEFLLGFCLDVESSLAGPLISRSLQFDLVFCHDLFHDLPEGCGFAILASVRKVDCPQGEAVCKNWGLDDAGLDTDAGTSCSTPGRLGSSGSNRSC